MSLGSLEWGIAAATMPGETESGDAHVACGIPDGMLLAVIDGLGHGTEAAAAATLAQRTLERQAGDDVVELLECCHESLRATRGATMSLAAFNMRAATLCWIGVGNVEAVLLRSAAGAQQEKLLQRGGLVGARLPPLQATVLTVAPGDLLIMATDGVAADFLQYVAMKSSPQAIAQRILAGAGKGSDDALVLVARYRRGEQ
jgi:negative regulator of sigma-B (phosphoserine phosphatase)